MVEYMFPNFASFFLGIVVGGVFLYIVRNMVRKAKTPGSSCCGCAGCNGCENANSTKCETHGLKPMP